MKTLAPDTPLGSYEIVAAIGAGGMGEVFRARDTNLNRAVAIKVLPAAMAADPERLARFKREAQVLASLNHPNVAHVYGFEAATLPDGSPAHFLAMELVEGEDLSERLKRGAIPLEEALPIAAQIAEGLEQAHEQGIIHRDLKPANIKVTPEGRVKVLDFGLAKALEGDPASPANSQLSHSPTMSRHMTEAGMIMGTAAYMSPEQARGKAVDGRADIWAFGVVLFEMLTGTRLFAGETVSDTLAAVLREEIPWDRLPAGTPPAVDRLLRRCLNRDPKRRLHSAADARLEIEEAGTGADDPSGRSGRHSRTEAAVKPAVATRTLWILVGVLALALIGALSRGLLVSGPSPQVTRMKVELAPDLPLAEKLGANAALSPDGRMIAFVTEGQGSTSLNVRRVDELEATALQGTDDAHSPFFSPDGRWIGFETSNRLMKVGVTGGAPVTLADVGANPGRGATWSGQQIVFARINTGLFKLADSGGKPEPLTTLDAAREERSHRWPSFLPGGRAVVFMVQHQGQDYDDADIEAVSLDDGRRTVLIRGGAFPRYAPGGYLLFARDHVLYAVRFDPDRLQVVEPATPVTFGLMSSTGNEAAGDGSAEFSLSAGGDLLYREDRGSDSTRGTDFAWLDGTGRETPAFHESIYATGIEISPDGRRIAFVGRSPRGQGIFIKDLDRGTVTPLTTDGAGELSPAWSPDGKRLAYTARSGVATVRIRQMDGGTADLELPAANSDGVGATSWLPDGSAIVAGLFFPPTLNDIFLLPLNGDKQRPLVDLPGVDDFGQVSPSGRWLAYHSDEKGQVQVFVTSIRDPGPRFQASVRGGGAARWSPDGRLLYFVETDRLDGPGPIVAVTVSEEGERLRFGTPRQISSSQYGMFRGELAVHPDGRILAIKRGLADAADIDRTHAVLVTGWREELARLMSGEK